jgi:hypothetical protein
MPDTSIILFRVLTVTALAGSALFLVGLAKQSATRN